MREDYLERVYSGILGKIIGVYLGRPFEGWSAKQIASRLGEIDWYITGLFSGVDLVVADDDISGTLLFLRALETVMADGGDRRLTSADVGRVWLDWLIEGRTALWWGGLGNSTEHTAYLRLKEGILPPASGSIATNGKIVAEQIGAQIFIDGWAMVSPGDPQQAAAFARQAASVSHDGEAIYAAQVIAAMEALAFVESDRDRLLDVAVGCIPADSTIARMIGEIREIHARVPDWRAAFADISQRYGYDRWPGLCHVVPNHALIILSLLYGEDDFGKTLSIAANLGWDTDCNCGNVGCLMGIKNGLAGIDAQRADGRNWRAPIDDRLYISCADGGSVISDAAREAIWVANLGRRLAGEAPIAPKGGARFHFSLPGSVQGFRLDGLPHEIKGCRLINDAEHRIDGSHCLCIDFGRLEKDRYIKVVTPTFIPDNLIERYQRYDLLACPIITSGQTIRARLLADRLTEGSLICKLTACYYRKIGDMVPEYGHDIRLAPGDRKEIALTLRETNGLPYAICGLDIKTDNVAVGSISLDWLTITGTPCATFRRPNSLEAGVWRMAWVDAIDTWMYHEGVEAFRISQSRGRGLLIQGTRDWRDYCVTTTLSTTFATALGIACRVWSLGRYYALLLHASGELRLLQVWDGEDILLGRLPFEWRPGRQYSFTLQVEAGRLIGSVDGRRIMAPISDTRLIPAGGLAFVIEEGTAIADSISIS